MTRVRTMALALALALALASCSSYRVYSVQSRPTQKVAGGMVYSLPHTLIRVAVTIEHTDLNTAPYADYCDMLALPSPDSLYRIASLDVSTLLVADPQQYYFVRPGRLPLTIDNRGLLAAIGGGYREEGRGTRGDLTGETSLSPIPHTLTQARPEYNLYDRTDTFYLRDDKPGRPSLVSSKKDVRSTRMRAEACAEQIQEIQERKQALLFGEYEGNYSGEAISFIFNQLTEREAQLTALFTGIPQRETIVFTVDPRDEKTLIDSQTVVLFHFDPAEGLVEEGGQEVLCEVRCDNSLRRAARFIKHRTRSVNQRNYIDRRTFKYRIPETATVRIYSDDFSFSRQVKVSQFGTVANLPTGRFRAHFDPQTGDLIHFSK